MSAYAKIASGNLAEVTATEEQAVRWSRFGAMFLWENSHYQYTLGFLPQEHWMRAREGIKLELQDPFLGPILLEVATQMRPSFRAVVEELARDLAVEEN